MWEFCRTERVACVDVKASVSDLLAAAVGAVPGGAERPGQHAMAEAIATAVDREEHLLVQAGTGTGKSLAYLVPSLLVKGPVVVSTATLALQSQLVDHDLPRLAEAVEPLLRRKPTFAVLKGRHHYLCLARLEGTSADEPDDALFDVGESKQTKWLGEAGRLGKQIDRLRDWAMETETGDRDELDPGVDDSAWKMVSMPARECVGAQRCPYGAECFAEASRARAREVDVVVTNHSLLAVDMLTGRQIIPPHELLVVDEAHELADRVSSASQAELTPDLLERSARRCRSYVDDDVADRLMEAGDALTVALADAPAGRITGALPTPLAEALTLLDAGGRKALDAIGEVKADDADPVRKQQAKTMITDLTKVAQRMLANADHDVTWIERDDRGRRAVVIAPLSVAGTLNVHLFHERTVVATSATLALGGQFDTVARSLGLPVAPPASPAAPGSPADAAREAVIRADAARDELTWNSLDVGSPFDYAKQGILYVAAHLPRPQTSGLPDATANEMVELVEALGGRALGLFSSRRAAERAAEVLRARTPGIKILLQGEEALPILVRKFREDRNSCLLGVMSLWQGVDVPGDACQLVIIDRLPFPRPDEPLAAARSAAVDASGGSGFAAISVPIAAVRLAQGVGRLIRANTDKGVVAVLDSRLETARSYGAYLRASLPPFWYTTKPDLVRGALKRLRAS
ncbi:ATP-dependent DNA helicase DinG [Dactylosporangium sucinum]|uniref:ATP-dependent DNA helicase DinG n=1 Tax=Dactylosporangium sucinum TaxID=1424081 RepID=A0A917UAB4_9ACTN|nr:ATP-dependent DNA helicase DinG [Dactylosporangium sucinum]